LDYKKAADRFIICTINLVLDWLSVSSQLVLVSFNAHWRPTYGRSL